MYDAFGELLIETATNGCSSGGAEVRTLL